MKKVMILFVSLAIAGCAKAPENIAAVPIESQSSASLSCSQLSSKDVEQEQLLQTLSSKQKQAQAGYA